MVRLWARDLILALNRPKGLSARNCMQGLVGSIAPAGVHQVEVRVMVDAKPVSVLVMSRTAQDMDLREGMGVNLVFKTASLELTGVRTFSGDDD